MLYVGVLWCVAALPHKAVCTDMGVGAAVADSAVLADTAGPYSPFLPSGNHSG